MTSGYMIANMLVPGQVERWISLADTSGFSLARLPVGIFKEAHGELAANFLEASQKSITVNLTYMQYGIAKFL